MTKTDKSKGMQFLVKAVNDGPLPDDANTMFILDGNTLSHVMTDITNKFQLITHRIFDNIPTRINFVFITDMYQGCRKRATWCQ